MGTLTMPAHGVGEGDLEEVVVLDEQPLHDGGQAWGWVGRVSHTQLARTTPPRAGGTGDKQEGCTSHVPAPHPCRQHPESAEHRAPRHPKKEHGLPASTHGPSSPKPPSPGDVGQDIGATHCPSRCHAGPAGGGRAGGAAAGSGRARWPSRAPPPASPRSPPPAAPAGHGAPGSHPGTGTSHSRGQRDESHLLTLRRASCSAYSSSMGTPCRCRYCRCVRSSRRASLGRKLLAHTWQGHGGAVSPVPNEPAPSPHSQTPKHPPGTVGSRLPPEKNPNPAHPQVRAATRWAVRRVAARDGPQRRGDRTGTGWEAPHCGEDSRSHIPGVWCCGVNAEGAASPGSAGAGWSSPSSPPCSRRSAGGGEQGTDASTRVTASSTPG